MSQFSNAPDGEGAIIKKTAQPAPVPADAQEQQDKASRSFLRELLNKIKGYTAQDAKRLKEAAIQIAEGEAAQKVNEARKIEAEAQKIHAEADYKRQKAALKEIEWRKSLREIEECKKNADIENTERQAAAIERLANAISVLKQKGGEVGFDKEQIENALKMLEEKREFKPLSEKKDV